MPQIAKPQETDARSMPTASHEPPRSSTKTRGLRTKVNFRSLAPRPTAGPDSGSEYEQSSCVSIGMALAVALAVSTGSCASNREFDELGTARSHLLSASPCHSPELERVNAPSAYLPGYAGLTVDPDGGFVNLYVTEAANPVAVAAALPSIRSIELKDVIQEIELPDGGSDSRFMADAGFVITVVPRTLTSLLNRELGVCALSAWQNQKILAMRVLYETNELVIGTRTQDLEAVVAEVNDAGLGGPGVRVRAEPEYDLQLSRRDRIWPHSGGMQMAMDGPPTICTMGFVVKNSANVTHVLTNSHCTASMFNQTSGYAWQPSWSLSGFGREAVDPPSNCLPGLCRPTDSALIRADSDSDFRFGFQLDDSGSRRDYAHLPCETSTAACPPAGVMSPEPYLQGIKAVARARVGCKVRRSGRTSGTIFIQVSSDTFMGTPRLNSTTVVSITTGLEAGPRTGNRPSVPWVVGDQVSLEGDSGGPVFTLDIHDATLRAVVNGLHFAGRKGELKDGVLFPPSAIFNSLSAIQDDLGPLQFH